MASPRLQYAATGGGGLRSSAIIAPMEERDVAVRNRTYSLFVELGRTPSAAEVRPGTGLTADEVVDAWRRLHDAHSLVLNANTPEIRMLNPFSAVPTAHRIHASGRWWYASCAWDAIGVCAALHSDGRIETSCPDCGEALGFDVKDGAPSDASLLFHCLVPASEWWADIVFT